jgi:tetratricopeptide (TPR) repeat protein
MSRLPDALQTILFMAANPKETVRRRLDQELRDIAEGLQRAQKRDQFRLQQRWAVRPRDIQLAMLEVEPQILHFAGHGEGAAGLVFEDEMGNSKPVDGDALAGLFALFADQLSCVVLNGCYSRVQAEAISEHIPYVIGMDHAIRDNKVAIAFSVGFYDALGGGRDVEFAYKFGCNAIHLEGASEKLKPVLLKNISKVKEVNVRVEHIPELVEELLQKTRYAHSLIRIPISDIRKSVSEDLIGFTDKRSRAKTLQFEVAESIKIATKYFNEENILKDIQSSRKLLEVANKSFSWHELDGSWQDWITFYAQFIECVVRSGLTGLNKDEVVPVLNLAGICFRMKNNLNEAKRFFDQANELVEDTDALKIDINLNFCDLERMAGNFDTALDYAENSLNLAFNVYRERLGKKITDAEKTENITRVARACEMKGLVYASSRDYGLATALQCAAIRKRLEASNDYHFYVRSLSYHSYASGLSGELSLALESYEKGLEIAEYMSDEPTLLRLHGDMATAYIRAAKKAKSRELRNKHWSSAQKCLTSVSQNQEKRKIIFTKRNHALYQLRRTMVAFGSFADGITKYLDVIEDNIHDEDWIENLTKFDIEVCDAVQFFTDLESKFIANETSENSDIARLAIMSGRVATRLIYCMG